MIKMSEAKLTIHIQNKRPIEVIDFTDSFNSLADEYYKFLSESDEFKLSKTTKLYIKEIRSGSIITELSDMVPYMIPFVERANSVMEFTSYVKSSFDYFLGREVNKPKQFDSRDCNNFNNIIKPVAKDNGSSVTYTGDWNINNSTVIFNYNSLEANAIQNGIEKEKQFLREPIANVHRNVLFYWDSAKYDDKSKAVDRGIIESLNSAALRVTFENKDTKKSMLDTDDNPFHYLFMVDVEVYNVQNIPTVYKILNVRESFKK